MLPGKVQVLEFNPQSKKIKKKKSRRIENTYVRKRIAVLSKLLGKRIFIKTTSEDKDL